MAYASFFDTHVTALRFKCLEWSVYLNSLNRDIDFQIYEDKENMKIDFEIVVRNVGVSHGYTDYHQGRAIHMADSRIH